MFIVVLVVACFRKAPENCHLSSVAARPHNRAAFRNFWFSKCFPEHSYTTSRRSIAVVTRTDATNRAQREKMRGREGRRAREIMRGRESGREIKRNERERAKSLKLAKEMRESLTKCFWLLASALQTFESRIRLGFSRSNLRGIFCGFCSTNS